MAILRRNIVAPRPPAEYSADIAARDAHRIAQSRGLRGIPFDVEGLATSVGIQVEYLPLADDISGFLRRRNGEWLIGVNSLHHRNRQRFTLAHELGHYFLHRDIGNFEDRALFRRELQYDRRESEANAFASKLLMPETEFRTVVLAQRASLETLARHFGVSPAAAKFRAEALGEERIVG
ncbi:ImmA/IrrE family metallo-endopeptidase [Bradyrhizobium sp. Rc3b]|uniref:ImmA/IrrE family metallo-endopeptidase n=1 Tax=Bradyrhizobium sp. Rc3b TaxID=1855322 RepID=UPI000B8493D8|nr:ImmA/IrrE family metallo-endopeptidase [Bradyrhizobium sp. Rc3b]